MLSMATNLPGVEDVALLPDLDVRPVSDCLFSCRCGGSTASRTGVQGESRPRFLGTVMASVVIMEQRTASGSARKHTHTWCSCSRPSTQRCVACTRQAVCTVELMPAKMGAGGHSHARQSGHGEHYKCCIRAGDRAQALRAAQQGGCGRGLPHLGGPVVARAARLPAGRTSGRSKNASLCTASTAKPRTARQRRGARARTPFKRARPPVAAAHGSWEATAASACEMRLWREGGAGGGRTDGAQEHACCSGGAQERACLTGGAQEDACHLRRWRPCSLCRVRARLKTGSFGFVGCMFFFLADPRSCGASAFESHLAVSPYPMCVQEACNQGPCLLVVRE